MTKKSIANILVVFILLTAISLMGCNDTKSTSYTSNDTNVIKISEFDLVNAFATNEIKAGKEYNNKIVEISGVVHDINGNSKQASIGFWPKDGKFNIQFIFSDKVQIDKLANLKVGDNVTIKGKISGRNMAIINVNECILTSVQNNTSAKNSNANSNNNTINQNDYINVTDIKCSMIKDRSALQVEMKINIGNSFVGSLYGENFIIKQDNGNGIRSITSLFYDNPDPQKSRGVNSDKIDPTPGDIYYTTMIFKINPNNADNFSLNYSYGGGLIPLGNFSSAK